MSRTEEVSRTATFDVKNVGGIGEAHVEIPPGVTVLSGKNATNRTSFLQAIMAAMGSTRATVKGDADEGRVALDLEGETYERRLTRSDGEVRFDGDEYLEDVTEADLFAFLLETNEVRQAVEFGQDLRELIMRPIDIEAIKRDIESLEEQKREINDELATIESRKSDLPNLEQERTSLQSRIEELREELADLEVEIDESSDDIEESRQEQEALEEKLDELRSARSDLETIRQDIEAQKDSISSLKRERSDLEEELSDLPDESVDETEHLDGELQRLRNQRQELNAEISDLQSLIQYNEERLAEEDYEVLADLEAESGTIEQTTDKLLPEDEIVCWTCGSTVERDQIEDTADRLRSLRTEKVSELESIKDELEDIKAEKRDIERKQQQREKLETRILDIEDEIDGREETLASLKDSREELVAEVETLESDVDELESGDFDEILDLHKEANQLEFEIERLESDLEEITTEIEEIESRIDDADRLREQRESILDELTDRRTKIEQIEEEAVDQFNEHMDAILEILDYENLDRIWIERVERTVREGRQKVDRSEFDLHVIRSTENGTAYEDRVQHLSESEREVTGLAFALAGYLVHDLHERVPFMLLDSLEAIDSDRIAALVDYFADYADYLVVALLEEDASALDDSYNYVAGI